MAGMRSVARIGLVAGVLALLAPAGAEAGTYDVVSCNAPGAGGRNNSLQYVAASFDPQYNPYLSSWYESDASCADGLVARSSTVNDGRQAKWLTTAYWTFIAPPGTEIVEMTSWRFAVAYDQPGDDPNTTGVDEGDHWRVEVVDHTNQPIGGLGGGETCGHGLGAPACIVGATGGRPQSNRVATDKLRWQIGCGGEIVGGCTTASATDALATMVVFGARITLEDNSAPSASLGGPLLAAGWHKPTDAVSYSAADNSGIRSATLDAGSLAATDNRRCDFTFKVPCSNTSNRGLTFPGTLPDGQYPLRLTVTDAAQNPRVVEAPVSIDGTAPRVDLRTPRKRTIIVGASDFASGLAAGQIDVRNSPTEEYRALPTRFRKGALRAKLDRGKPRNTTVRVTVADNAGNTITGIPARFRITSVTSQRLRAHVRKRGRVRVKHGRPLTIRGQLVLSAGQPVEGVPITVTSQARVQGAVPYVETTGGVGPNGRFVVRLPKGPARTATISFPGVPGGMPAERRLKLAVPASSTIKASRTRLSGAGRVRFSGRVRGGAGPNLVVVLQGQEGGTWRTFADTRTRKGGRWRSSYGFSGRPGSYPVRVRIRRQANLPYVTGHSKRITVHVD